MRAIVTGGAGFIGSHLCRRLLQEGIDVICVDNLSTGRETNIADLRSHNGGFEFLQQDVTRPLPANLAVDWVFHLASAASPPAYRKRPIETLRVNGEGTRLLLEWAAEHGAKFLFASSSEIYGDALQHPQKESYRGNVNPTGPRSIYHEGKRYGEALTAAFGRYSDVEVRIVRLFNTYGPGMDPQDGRLVSNFTTQALQGTPLTIYGDGSQTRSLQYVDDLMEALIRLMQVDYREPVNLGNPEEHTVLELAYLIKGLTESHSPVMFGPLPEDDPARRRPDIALAKQLLGWEPRVSVEEGLERTVHYFREPGVLD